MYKYKPIWVGIVVLAWDLGVSTLIGANFDQLVW